MAAALGLVAIAGLASDVASFALARRGIGGPRLTMRRVELGGASGLVLEAGQGPCVLVLASMLVRARSYLPLLRQLSVSHRVLVVELPGSGSGSRLRRPWSVQQYASWTERLISELELRELTLIGHSNSGAVALTLAARVAPASRVSLLVLVGSVGARMRRGVLRVIAARTLDGTKELGLDLRGWWHLAWNMLFHPRSFVAHVRLASHAWLVDAARAVRVPTLLAWAKSDRTMPLSSAQRLQAWIPQARLLIGPGSHDWLVTHPRAFVEQVFGSGMGSPSMPGCAAARPLLARTDPEH